MAMSMCSVRNTILSSRLLVPLRTLLLPIILCSAAPISASAGGPPVDIRPSEPGQLEVEPAGIATIAFFVANTSGGSLEVVEAVGLPERWELVTGESSLELRPREERLRLVGFHVPFDAPAGSYTIKYEVRDHRGVSTLAWSEANVAVQGATGLSIVDCGAPQRVVAGETLRARFEIVNSGNSASRIRVRVTSSESYPTQPDTVDLLVSAGQSREFTVEIGTPIGIEKMVHHALTVCAITPTEGGAEAMANCTVIQQIIPRAGGVYDPYHRLPSALRTTYVGGGGGTGVQIEYSGRGRLAEGGGAEVDFLLRGPDVHEDSVFGLRDEYWLRLAGAAYSVQAGDGVYDLSPLTARHRRGRGLGIAFESGNWALGGSYMRAKWSEPRVEEGAAYVRFGSTERFELGLNYLSRSEGSNGNTLSVRATAKPKPSIDLDVEYAVGDGDGDSRAYRARLQGMSGGVRYLLHRTRAGRGYIGQYADEVETAGSVSLPTFWGLRLRGFYRDWDRNGNRNVDGPSWTREQVSDLGLKTALPLGMRAAINYRDVTRGGRTGTSVFDYETGTVRIGIEWPHPTISAGGSLELGELRNRIERQRHDVSRYAFRLNCKPSSCCRVSGHFQSALSGSGDPATRNDVAGVRLDLRPSDDLHLAASFQWRDYSEDAGSGVDELTVRADYKLPSRHKVSASLRWTTYEQDRSEQTVFSVAYEIPIGLRGARRQSTGSLKGTVTDAEDPLHSGLEDVVLLLGDFARITDQDGQFAFPSLEPGNYYLTVDRASVGLDRVSTRKLPLKVSIVGGREAKIDLGVVTPGSVEGEVVVDGSSARCVSDEGGAGGHGPSPFIVELSSELETVRCVTDSAGAFAFEEVRPGSWLLTVHPHVSLPHLELVQDTPVVEVLPGGASWVTARVASVRREIPIVEKGTLRVSNRTP
jgi:hypothetical protein